MTKVYAGLITVLASACICFGQTAQKQKTPAIGGESQKGEQVALASGTSINAQLEKSLDVKNAKVGDEVVLKTTQSIRKNGEIVVPKGASLIGRVTEVQRRTKDNAQSRIGLVFDRLKGKELSMPLSATIVSITNATARTQVDDTLMGDVSGSSRTSSTTSSSGSSGGGLLGGVGSAVGGVVNTSTQTVGSVTNATGQALGNTTRTVGQTMDGIRITNDIGASANSSTTLSSGDKNFRVEKGAAFHLRVVN